MSKKRRIRKHRSQWDRIEWRRNRCESKLRRGEVCRHRIYFMEGTFDNIAKAVLAMDAPSVKALENIACARRWEVIRHPMTQLYAMVDPQWYFDLFTRKHSDLERVRSGQSTPATRRSILDMQKMLAKVSLGRRSRRAVQLALFSVYGNAWFVTKQCHKFSNRRRLLQARRIRAIARKNKAASLNDKYGRPRLSRTGEPSR